VPNAVERVGENRERYLPNPSVADEKLLDMFKFLGE